MAGKNNIRSIRFSDEMIELINQQIGDTFTAKFEALVTKCVWELPAKEKQLQHIQDQIDREGRRLREAANEVYKFQNILATLNRRAMELDNVLKNSIEDLKP